MERIRQALEQAEIDRQKSGDIKKANTPAASQASAGPSQPVVAEKAVSSPDFVPAKDLVYTHTRCVDVSKKTLIDNNLVAALPGHELQDTYRMLRTRVMREMKANGWRMILVTGPHQGAGKSMTAVNLAIAMSMDTNSTVLLVDADLREPSLHKYFGVVQETGFSDYLTDGAPIEDMLFHPNNIDRLVVLPGKDRIENSAEMLGSPRAAHIANELKNRYDDRIIIVDGPPVLSSDDVVVTDNYIDAVLLVAEAGVTKKEELQETLRILGNIPVIGTVLNRVPNLKARARY